MMSPSTIQMIEIGRDVPVGKVKIEKESVVSCSYFNLKLCPSPYTMLLSSLCRSMATMKLDLIANGPRKHGSHLHRAIVSSRNHFNLKISKFCLNVVLMA